MSGCRVIVVEHRTRGLVDSDGTTDVSPPQTEQGARALLARATAGAGGCGPWRQPVAGGQRIIQLERLR